MEHRVSFEKFTVALVSLVLFGAGCATKAPTSANVPANANQPAASTITDDGLRNMGYPVNGFPGIEAVTLTDGYSRFTDPTGADNGYARLGDAIAHGDLNGDGIDDAAVVLYVNTGGSGTWPVVYAVLSTDGRPVPHQGPQLEDRSKVNGASIDEKKLSLDLTLHGPSDPACCPTLNASKTYAWDGVGNRFDEVLTIQP